MRATSAFVLGTLLVATPLVGCNAAMGIEPAEVYESGGKSATGGTGGTGTAGGGSSGQGSTQPYPFVAKEDACTSCMATGCASVLDACFPDLACRSQLDQHTVCLARGQATASGCTEELPPELGLCLVSKCDTPCAESALASRCELHCACLATECTDVSPMADCVARCESLLPAKQACLFLHCQVSGMTTLSASVRATHCKHARRDPGFDVCPDAPEPCTSGDPSGAPCTGGDTCCTRSCTVSGVCE